MFADREPVNDIVSSGNKFTLLTVLKNKEICQNSSNALAKVFDWFMNHPEPIKKSVWILFDANRLKINPIHSDLIWINPFLSKPSFLSELF